MHLEKHVNQGHLPGANKYFFLEKLYRVAGYKVQIILTKCTLLTIVPLEGRFPNKLERTSENYQIKYLLNDKVLS